MRKGLFLIAFSGLVVGGLQFANAANLLSNPDLDNVAVGDQALATPISWHVTANKSVSGPFTDGASSETFANVLQAGGDGLFFKAFQGTITPTVDLISVELYQDDPATPGTPYSLTGWAGAGAGYIGLTDPTVKSQFELEFFNSSNAVVGTSTLDLNALGVDNGNPFNYNQYTLTGTAPAGTTTVRTIVQMLNAYGNPAGGDQAFVTDSLDLEAVPEPACLAVTAISGLLCLGRRQRRSAR